MMTPHGTLTVATLIVVSVRISTTVADDALTNRFLQEAPRKWQEYKTLFTGFDSASEHTTEFVPLGAKGKGEKTIERDSDRVIVDDSKKNSFKKRGREVSVSNQDYYFTLRQSDPSDTNSFAVVYLSPRRQLFEDANGSNYAVRAQRSRVGTIWQLPPLDLNDIVSSPTFKVISAAEVQHDGESAVQIDFQYGREPNKKGKYPFGLYKGSVRLSPKKYWAVIKGTITVDDPKKQLGSYELKNQLGPFASIPVVVESEYVTYDPDHYWLATVKSKYSWSKYDGKKDIFRLSGYGL